MQRGQIHMKTGFISIVGRANVGKSTLLNAIIGEKVAIVSSKPQTTRSKIIGIYNDNNIQLVFVDTPGLHIPKNKLGQHMIRQANDAMDGVDAILLVVEPRSAGRTELSLIEKFKTLHVPVILVINKIDKVKKADVAKAIENYAGLYDFASVIPMSALRKDGVQIVLDELLPLIKGDGICYYPNDIATSQTIRQMASEIVREKILCDMYDEIPHGVAVEIESFREQRTKSGEVITSISVAIVCERAAHKGMIIGKQGKMLKKMAAEARRDLEELIGTKVYLECFVKVKEGWRDNERMISQLQLYDE